MKLIVGLGNYGKEYEKTRHNVGFMVVDHFANRFGVSIDKKDFKGVIARFKYKQEDILLLKPQTYMNLSGESVRLVKEYFQIDIDDIVVIYDDMDLDVGQIRLREKGSGGGHNGMKNIIENIGSSDYKRIRIGIGRNDRIIGANYVLGRFTQEELEKINQAVEKASNALKDWLEERFQLVMNKYN